MRRIVLLLCLIIGVSCDYVSFKDHKVIRVTPQSREELTILHNLLKDTTDIDVWKAPAAVNSPVDIRLPPFRYDDVVAGLADAGFTPQVLITDVQDLIDEQMSSHDFQPKSAPFNYSKYHTLDEINAWMENITNVYKNMATLINVATSYEKRQLTGIKISASPEMKRPGFWIEGGIHAREWISPATVIYMAGQMLAQYGTDPLITAMVKQFDWYILPVTNPDGYVYTWEKNRMWRKTRSKQGICWGVDPNRNWDMEWCKAGASRKPCSDTYCGPKAFSESEVHGVANYLENKVPNCTAFIDFHSYSQLWMSPWGYTKELPPDFTVQDNGSKAAIEALYNVYGTKYQHGTLASTVYISSGSSADWTYGKAGIKFSYGVELRDTGEYGFLLPESQIIPSGKETLQALIALSDYIHNHQ